MSHWTRTWPTSNTTASTDWFTPALRKNETARSPCRDASRYDLTRPNGPSRSESALARLEPAVGLVDHVSPATAADHAVVPVTIFQGLQAVANLHDVSRLAVARR